MGYFSDWIEDSICMYGMYDMYDDCGGFEDEETELCKFQIVYSTDEAALVKDLETYKAAWFPLSIVDWDESLFYFPSWFTPKWVETFNPETDFEIE